MRAVNLIPAQQRGGGSVGAGRSEGAAYGVIALVGGLAVLAFAYGSAHHEIASKEGKAATINAQVSQTKSQAATLAPYTSFVAMREQRLQAVTSLVDTRFDWAHVFHEFARVLPLTVSISSLNGTVGQAGASTPAPAAAGASSVASATPPGSVPTFTLSGCATTQQEVARMLTRLRLMDGVNAVSLQTSAKGAAGGGAAPSTGTTPCPAGAPTFTAQITFDPLPTPSATAPAAKTASSAATANVSATTTSAAVAP